MTGGLPWTDSEKAGLGVDEVLRLCVPQAQGVNPTGTCLVPVEGGMRPPGFGEWEEAPPSGEKSGQAWVGSDWLEDHSH